MLRIILFATLINLVSCSHYISLNERLKNNHEQQNNIKNKDNIDEYGKCHNSNKSNILGENESTLSSFKVLIKRIKKRYKLSSIEEGVILSIVQLISRPDLSTPTSNLQLVVSSKGLKKFIFFTKAIQKKLIKNKSKIAYPYIYGLSYILKQYKSNYRLLDLVKVVDNSLVEQIKVDSELAEFLKLKRSELLKGKVLKKFYFKAGISLRQSEKIPRFSLYKQLSKLLKKFPLSRNDYSILSYTFPYAPFDKSTNNFRFLCNIDLNLYAKEIYPITPNKQFGNVFILNKGVDSFIGISSDKHTRYSQLLSSPMINVDNSGGPIPICLLKDKKQKFIATIIAQGERNPGQYMYDIVNQIAKSGIDDITLTKIIKKQRKLFLVNPFRVVIENNLKQELLENLRSKNIPIYFYDKLGEVIINKRNKIDNKIIEDKRSSAQINCN